MNDIEHFPELLEAEHAQEVFELLKENTSWQVWIPSPKSRKIAMYDDSIDVLPTCILDIIEVIELSLNTKLRKQCFMNFYMNGDNYCPYHADAYGMDTYTLSLGGTRDFLMKSNQPGTKADKYTLRSGDLYFMSKSIHLTHKHSVPKRKNQIEQRISILFFSAL